MGHIGITKWDDYEKVGFNSCSNTNFLLTEREVCTVKYQTEAFFVHKPSPYGEVCTKRPRSDISLYVQAEQARLIKSLLYGIYT